MGIEVLDVNGQRLTVLSEGAGGVPLMLVHGFTGCKEDFADEIGPLAERGFWVVAPDLRGHGESDHPEDEEQYSLEIYAEEVFGLADALGWHDFHLLGHSMGGMVAQVMVIGRSERIRSVVLMNTHHGVLGNLDLELVRLGQQLARTDGLGAIQTILQMGRNPLDNPAYERICEERPGYREWAEAKMLACSPVMYAAMLGQLAEVEDRLEALRSLDVPTLAVVGGLDAAFLPATRALADTIPGARYVELTGGGHSPQFESTEAWRKAIHEFLDEVGG